MLSLSTNLIIGNIISAIAAVFTAKSAYVKDRWHIYFYQVLQCLLLAVASIFFNSYAGIVTLTLCAIRNLLLAYDKFDKKYYIASVILLLVLGIIVNNRGIVGYIVIAANVFYTVGCYYTKKELYIKLNIAIDMILWIIYEFLIVDIPSLIADSIALTVAFYAVIRCIREKDKDNGR